MASEEILSRGSTQIHKSVNPTPPESDVSNCINSPFSSYHPRSIGSGSGGGGVNSASVESPPLPLESPRLCHCSVFSWIDNGACPAVERSSAPSFRGSICKSDERQRQKGGGAESGLASSIHREVIGRSPSRGRRSWPTVRDAPEISLISSRSPPKSALLDFPPLPRPRLQSSRCESRQNARCERLGYRGESESTRSLFASRAPVLAIVARIFATGFGKTHSGWPVSPPAAFPPFLIRCVQREHELGRESVRRLSTAPRGH